MRTLWDYRIQYIVVDTYLLPCLLMLETGEITGRPLSEDVGIPRSVRY